MIKKCEDKVLKAMSYPTCPICLDGMKRALLFTCQHFACSVCTKAYNSFFSSSSSVPETTIYRVGPKQAYKLKAPEVPLVESRVICPVCSELVECKLADWLDSPVSDEEDLETKEPVSPKCPLGIELMEKSEKLKALIKSSVDYSSSIISDKEQELTILEQKLKQALEQIRLEHQIKVDKLKRKTEMLLDQEASRVKQHDYATQSIEHMSLTLKSLACQTPEVIGEFFPQFQAKLDELMFPWPLGITPSYPDVIFDSPCMEYVPELQDFVYYRDGSIILGAHKALIPTKIKDYDTTGVIPNFIKVFSHSRDISKSFILVCYVNQHCDKMFVCVYDLTLQMRKVDMIRVSDPIIGIAMLPIGEYVPVRLDSIGISLCFTRLATGSFAKKEINYAHVEFIDGISYTSTPMGIVVNKDDCLPYLQQWISEFTHFFIKDGAPRFYKHQSQDEDYVTILDLGEKTMTLPGKGHFYPGARDSILYKCGKHCKLLFVQFPPFTAPRMMVRLPRGN